MTSSVGTHRGLAVALALAAASSCVAEPSRPPTAGEPTLAPIRAVRPTARPTFWVEAPVAGDPSPLLARIPATGVILEAGRVRLLPPKVAPGARRVGIHGSISPP